MASLTAADGSENLVWYFAYGSNMLSAKFTGGRGIVPIKKARVRTPGWILALDIPGMPYSEPTFTSLLPRDKVPPVADTVLREPQCSMMAPLRSPSVQECEKSEYSFQSNLPDALGVAYLITEEQYARVIGSEGGGIAYADVQVHAEPIEEEDCKSTGGNIVVHTLISVLRRKPWPRPSKRYMNIITDGAREASLPRDYQKFLQDIPTYEPPHSKRRKAGAAVFVGFWGPVMALMEKITHATIREDGYCPWFVIWLVRVTMILIWFTHDTFFAPLFGRGDGHGDDKGGNAATIDEETALLLKSG